MDKPLHVQVAEALGDQFDSTHAYLIGQGGSYVSFACMACGGRWGQREKIPLECSREKTHRYDKKWSLTGPLIKRYKLQVGPSYLGTGPDKPWCAAAGTDKEREGDVWAQGDTPLEAVCLLIIALSTAGKLK